MKHLICATIALTLLATTAAVAQRDNRSYQGQNYDPRQNGGGRFDPEGFSDRSNDRPHWSRGDRLPGQYRQDAYIVRDWQQRNLRTPPRGYRWVRNDNDQYLLAAIATGIIAEIVNQNQYRDDYRWSRGDRLSGEYLQKRYVVSDWRANRLHRPARGYHWVRINNQFMLTAIASGVIAEVALNDR
jgi:Ni/Co efflux regulator RcnB